MRETLKGHNFAVGLAATAAALSLTAAAVSIHRSRAQPRPSPSQSALSGAADSKHRNQQNTTPARKSPCVSHSSHITCPDENPSANAEHLELRERIPVSTSEVLQTRRKPEHLSFITRFPSHASSSKPPLHLSTAHELCNPAVSTATQQPQPQPQADCAPLQSTARSRSNGHSSKTINNPPTPPEIPSCNTLTRPDPFQSQTDVPNPHSSTHPALTIHSAKPLPKISTAPPITHIRPEPASQSPNPPHPRHWTVFWDLENVPVPRGVRGHLLVHSLRESLSLLHPVPILRITAVCNVLRLNVTLRNQLQASGVTLVHVETCSRKDAADKALISEMCLLAVEHPPPVGVVLMSADADFAYPLSRMRGLGYFTVVVASGNGFKCGALLKEAPNVLWDLRTNVLARELVERNGGVGSDRKVRRKKRGGKKGVAESASN